MKKLLTIAVLLLFFFNSRGQTTLQHTFPSVARGGFEVVNLSISGKKILVLTDTNTLSFYNLDYSLWKTITVPSLPPYGHGYLTMGVGGNVFYPSEELFNTDPLLEVAIWYAPNYFTSSTVYVINENGVAVDSITNAYFTNDFDLAFHVYNTTGNNFVAAVGTTTGTAIYNLPGTIPCDVCGGRLGIGKVEPKTNGVSEPIPNPSDGQVKITFTLPEGTKNGEIDIFNTNGQRLKTYKVDNTFGFITVDNSTFPAGIYYYNLIADGNIATTKKMVVIK